MKKATHMTLREMYAIEMLKVIKTNAVANSVALAVQYADALIAALDCEVKPESDE